MLDAADILVDIHPIGGVFHIGGRCGARCGEARVIPRRIDKGVHRIGLAPGGGAAGGAGAIAPCGVAVERVAGNVKADIAGQFDRQALFLLGHHAAGVAMHDRNGAAPVALARQAPVAQAELGHAMADPLALAMGDGGVDGLCPGRLFGPVEGQGPAHAVGFGWHEGRAAILGQHMIACKRHEGRGDGQAIFPREIEVALVMGGAAEDRAGAIVHQDEIGDVDGQFPRGVKGVAHAQPGVKAQLLGLFDGLLGGAALAGQRAERGDIGVGGFKRLGNRVVGRDADETCAHQRVGAGGIDLHLGMAMRRGHHVEGELQPARTADPIGLHRLDLGGPVIKPIQRIKQFAREIGDLEEPLRQLAPLHICARAPALAVDHLFIGKHRHIDRVPVHHRVLAIDEALLQEIEKQRLLLAVVFGVAGGEHARPVKAKAQGLHLGDHGGDILICPIGGVTARGHRRILGGHAEGVKAHRVQHVKAIGQFVARDHIAHGVVAHMADMDAPRGIGEHLEHVVFRLVVTAARDKGLGLFPFLLPFGFQRGGVVARHGAGILGSETKTPGIMARRADR